MAHLPMFLFDDEEAVNQERRDQEELEVGGPQNVEPERRRIPRQFRDPIDPLYIPDEQLMRYYRFPRHEILELCDIVRPALERTTRRSHALPLMVQVLVCLRFLASGSFQHVLGDTTRISQPSCSRIIGTFCRQIVEVADQIITFTLNDGEYITSLKQGFYRIAEFPNILGCIDGTHIRIKKPQVDPDNYMNRKGFYSLNVQVVCDANLKFTNICVRWPGSSHDGFIWENSGLKQGLELWGGNGWLLGDSGYPCERRLLTPFRNPANNEEERYNTAHIRTRNTIERCIGVWKSRFRCLDSSGGTLQYSVGKVRDIVIAAAVLHNRCIERRIQLNGEDIQRDVEHDEEEIQIDYANDIEGIRIRRDVVNRYFT